MFPINSVNWIQFLSLCEKHILSFSVPVFLTVFLWVFDLAEFERTGRINLLDSALADIKKCLIMRNKKNYIYLE